MALDEAVKRYQETKGAAPTSIDDLATAGLIAERPADPLGGKFFINTKGAVQNTTLLDSQTEERSVFLQGSIDRYKEQNGAWPESLDGLREKGYAVPTYPYLDREWRYDPRTGEVR